MPYSESQNILADLEAIKNLPPQQRALLNQILLSAAALPVGGMAGLAEKGLSTAAPGATEAITNAVSKAPGLIRWLGHMGAEAIPEGAMFGGTEYAAKKQAGLEANLPEEIGTNAALIGGLKGLGESVVPASRWMAKRVYSLHPELADSILKSPDKMKEIIKQGIPSTFKNTYQELLDKYNTLMGGLKGEKQAIYENIPGTPDLTPSVSTLQAAKEKAKGSSRRDLNKVLNEVTDRLGNKGQSEISTAEIEKQFGKKDPGWIEALKNANKMPETSSGYTPENPQDIDVLKKYLFKKEQGVEEPSVSNALRNARKQIEESAQGHYGEDLQNVNEVMSNVRGLVKENPMAGLLNPKTLEHNMSTLYTKPNTTAQMDYIRQVGDTLNTDLADKFKNTAMANEYNKAGSLVGQLRNRLAAGAVGAGIGSLAGLKGGASASGKGALLGGATGIMATSPLVYRTVSNMASPLVRGASAISGETVIPEAAAMAKNYMSGVTQTAGKLDVNSLNPKQRQILQDFITHHYAKQKIDSIKEGQQHAQDLVNQTQEEQSQEDNYVPSAEE